MKIQLDEETHTYTVDGKVVPSVTQILKPLECWENVPREAMEAAADFGRKVHKTCHLFNLERLNMLTIGPELRARLEGWRRFIADTGFVITMSEYMVAHPTLGYAGTIDAGGLLPKRGRKLKAIVDIKTPEAFPRTAGPQSAGYAKCLPDVALRLGVQLFGDSTYKIHTLDDVRDWNTFVSCLNIWRWRNT